MVKKSKSGKKGKGSKGSRPPAAAAAAAAAGGTAAADGGGKRAKAEAGGRANAAAGAGAAGEEELVFEDPFEDEFEEEEHLFNEDAELPDDEEEGEEDGDGVGAAAEAVEGMEVEDEPRTEVRTFRPGLDGLDEVPEGEELEYDPSAYHMYHSLRPEWPCLSFDFVRDKLGANRVRYPHTVYAVAGTQAARGQANKIQVMKLAELHKTQKATQDEDEDDEESDGEDDNDVDPTLDHIDIPHSGAVNRIRSMPQQPGIVATWSDRGHVLVTDATQQIAALDRPGVRDANAPVVHTFRGHPDEGFAIDWSKATAGRLVSGCCGGHIYVHEPQEGGTWVTDAQPSKGHTGSVEDLQWSPTEQTVFASASADGSVAIWDTRKRGKAMITVAQAHAASDVNVMSWNASITYLLASGGDDGTFKVWDLRSFGKGTPDPVAQFSWHKAPITSVEWDPNDESMIAVSGADNQLTVWDLSVEADDGDILAGPNCDQSGAQELKLPPQLLFVHQGQHDIKELHFHPQVPGVIMSTASDGFNVWKPATVLQSGET